MTEPHKTAVIVGGDFHTNSITALTKPGFTLDGGGTVTPGKTPREMWRAWVSFWDTLPQTYPADEYVYILNGDAVEADSKQRSNALYTRNKADLIRMALEVQMPALNVADAVYVLRGTEAHVGGSGEYEELLAQDIATVVPDPGSGAASWWHLQREFSGVRFDVAHHAGMGGLPWTEKNAANKLAANVIFSGSKTGQALPHLVLRSHVHRVSDTGIGYTWTHGLRALTLPAWETKTPFVRRISNGRERDPSDIGLFIFTCQNGHYDFSYLQVRLYEEHKRTWIKHQ